MFYNEQKMTGNIVIFSGLLLIFYSVISTICIFGGGYLFVLMCSEIGKLLVGQQERNYFTGGYVVAMFLGVVWIFFVRGCFKIAIKEVENNRDIQVTGLLFSAIVAFGAMIVSIVSVFLALY